MSAITEVLYGIHPVREAIEAGRRKIHAVHILDAAGASARVQAVVDLAGRRALPVERLSPENLRRLAATGSHQGVAATVDPYPYTPWEGKAWTRGAPLFLLLLDGIQDPHNLGAMLRTALSVGVDAVVIPRDRSVGATPAVSRVSSGALEHVRLARVTNLVAVIRQLSAEGVWVFGLEGTARQTIFDTDFSVPLALVVGAEEKGIRPLVASRCDQMMSIPLVGALGSLNASVAGAVAMYEVFRQRRMRAAGPGRPDTRSG